jgi:predicted metal-dependent phosphoesterase TrpH
MTNAAFAREGRFWRGNLHTHSTRSDGRLPPEAVAAYYRDAGYDFLAITDHFWERYGFPITDTRPLRSKAFTTLLGAEIHAPVTAKNHDWHVVALGLPLDYAPWSSGETIQSMCRRAHAAGAFLGLAHPQWYGLTLADALSIPEAHAIEIYNHGCAVD